MRENPTNNYIPQTIEQLRSNARELETYMEDRRVKPLPM
jgi:hypothetical protein